MNLDRYEPWRQQAMHDATLIDALTEERVDRVRWIARQHYEVTDAWFTLPGEDQQWRRTRVGALSTDIPDALSLAHRTLRHDALFVIEDARCHPEFTRHPLVVGSPGLRFYAGVPVRDHEGVGIGALCLVHTSPVSAAALNFDMLHVLASQIADEIGHHLLTRRPPGLTLDDIDTLTGLPNRRFLQTLMKAELTLARQHRGHLSVCLLNLDGFKSINELHGSDIGDAVLRTVAARLRDAVRRKDLVIHLGGDEFVIVMRDVLQAEACQRILDQIRSPIETSGHVHALTASMGITGYPGDEADVDVLLHHAYQAMYSAKEAGKNGYCRFDLELHHARRARIAIVGDVHQALSQQRLELFYQPKIDYRDDTVAGFEGLLRWRLPSGEILPPGRFLPHVENTWLDVELSKYVIDKGLTALEHCMQRGLPYAVSVNVNPSCFLDSGFIDHLHQTLARHDQELVGRLTLEILESTSPQQDMDTIVANIRGCLRLGLQLSLDDFGTGQSSLSYLRTFPTQKIKIDRSFVIGMLDSPEDEAIVAAIIGLSKSFKRLVIAEGVENGAIESRLRALGCDLGQGFHYSPALPFEDAIEWAGEYCLHHRAF
ncbi:sensor domain-containing phosphodiesterase [Salinicola sp. CPA57]|uniref:putative bifunctional diguanylate cyclase/phosphodiesterase n=1 Tax=Salinicola sp. CPA57 TaxID=1949080 RepID=UPI000DA1717C|nr:sensor domain-containing phosphodiesterase [Salinicola sp. CPA57]